MSLNSNQRNFIDPRSDPFSLTESAVTAMSYWLIADTCSPGPGLKEFCSGKDNF